MSTCIVIIIYDTEEQFGQAYYCTHGSLKSLLFQWIGIVMLKSKVRDSVADPDRFLWFRQKPPFKFSLVAFSLHKHYCIDNLS